MENELIVKNLGRLQQERSNIEGIWDLVNSYVVPYRSEIYNQGKTENSVEWRNRTLFDATAADACETLSSTIHGSITSISIKFFTMKFRQEELNDDQEAREWLQMCEELVYEELQESNFDTEAAEFYLDLTSYGTSVIVQEAESEIDWEGIDFSSVPINECYFDEDHKGNIVNFYRELEWTPIQIIEKFGRDNVPQSIIDKEHTQNKIKLVFCIFKRNGVGDEFTIAPADKRPYGRKYVIIADKTELGEEGGYYEMPAFVTRWRKTSSSKWGFSPAFVCMSDILSLNQLVEDTFEALGKAIDPATLTTKRGVLSDLDLGRAALSVVGDINEVKAYESRARFDVGEMKIDRLQESIRKAFHIDKFQMKSTPAMTAEEVRARFDMMHRMLGPTSGRLQNDFLDPCVTRTFNMMYRAKRLPEMPEVVKKLKGRLTVEYTGPLAKAQRKVVVGSTMEWLGNLASLSDAFPEVLDIPDMDTISRTIGDLSGVPAKFMHTKTDIEKARKQKAERMAKNMEVQDAKSEGEAKLAQGQGEAALREVGANGQ